MPKMSITSWFKGEGNRSLVHSPQPSNISYAWNFGVRRVRAIWERVCPDSIVYLIISIICLLHDNMYLNYTIILITENCILYDLRGFTYQVANKCLIWVVGSAERLIKTGLSPLVYEVSRCSYVEANEPDTLWCDLFSKCILSRICRYVLSIAIHGIQNVSGYQGAQHPSCTGMSRIEQAAKVTRTINRRICQPWETTAYDSYTITRIQSRRSSSSTGAKEHSVDTLDNKATSKSTKGSLGKTKSSSKTVKPNLASIVASKLNDFITYDSKFSGLIRIIADPYFLIACYEEIKGKPGNMTRGTTKTTLDGLTFSWLEKTALQLKTGKFDFQPARRIEIPKANSNKMRPLTISSPRDKIVQKALQVIVEAIWEPMFLDSSHGFRPKRSVHSALYQLYYGSKNFIWVIHHPRGGPGRGGDISKCFDTIPHKIIMNRIRKKIVDPRILELIKKFLEMGIRDPKTNITTPTTVGIPQGGVLSPILCNLVLHTFDEYMQRQIDKFWKGKRRAHNREYQKLENRRRKSNNLGERKELLKEMRRIGNVDILDPGFRRMKYIRYADDFVILIIGTKDEANMIKYNCKEFLKVHCGVIMSEEKTTISNLLDNKFHFIGAQIQKLNRNHTFVRGSSKRRMVATAKLLVKAPITNILKKLKLAGFLRQDNRQIYRPKHKGSLTNLSHYDILAFYNSKIHGILNFYSFASNLNKLSRIVWYLHASCALTLSRKYRLGTMSLAYKKFGRWLMCPETEKKIYIPDNYKVKHIYQKTANIPKVEDVVNMSWAAKLTETKFGKACVICGTTEQIQMHHVRSVKDVRAKLKIGNSTFEQWVGAVKIKQILCQYHHGLYHKGQLTPADMKEISCYTG